MASGNIRAAQDGKPLAGPKELPPTQIGKVTLYKEDEPPTVGQRLAVKGLLAAAGIPYEAGQEGAQIPALLQRLKDLAGRAGGPPPLPESPDTAHIDALLALGGNQLFRGVADDHERLSKDLERWRMADQQREKREAEWRDLHRLLRHAEDLPIAGSVAPTADAIRDGRQLLDDPDPIAPLLDELTDALRSEVKQRAEQLASAQASRHRGAGGLGGVGPARRREARVAHRGREAASRGQRPISPRTPSCSSRLTPFRLADGRTASASCRARRDQARQRAAKELEPESVRVTPPSATSKTPDDLKAYLDGLRAQVQPHLDAEKTVIL